MCVCVCVGGYCTCVCHLRVGICVFPNVGVSVHLCNYLPAYLSTHVYHCISLALLLSCCLSRSTRTLADSLSLSFAPVGALPRFLAHPLFISIFFSRSFSRSLSLFLSPFFLYLYRALSLLLAICPSMYPSTYLLPNK